MKAEKNIRNTADRINSNELRFNDYDDVLKVKYYWNKYKNEIISDDELLNSFTFFIENHNVHMSGLNLKSMF